MKKAVKRRGGGGNPSKKKDGKMSERERENGKKRVYEF